MIITCITFFADQSEFLKIFMRVHGVINVISVVHHFRTFTVQKFESHYPKQIILAF